MKVDRLPVAVSHILDDVFEEKHLVGAISQGRELVVDLRLTAGGHLVMLTLNLDPAIEHHLDHLVAQVLVFVRRGNREITFFVAGLVTPGSASHRYRCSNVRQQSR